MDTQTLDDDFPISTRVQPGDRLHALAPISVIGSASGHPITLSRGDELTVTRELIRLNTSRTGECAFDNASRFMAGPAPTGMLPDHGSSRWEQLREAARAQAFQLADVLEREKALAELRDTFGPPDSRSRTLRTNPSV